MNELIDFIYVRVSTDDKGQKIINQLLRLIPKVYGAEKRKFRVYWDEETAKTLHRNKKHGFPAMMDHLDECRGIWLTHPDRYSRNLIEALNSMEEIAKAGKFLRFLEGGLVDEYPIPPGTWLGLGVQWLIAEYDNRHKSIMVKAGMKTHRPKEGWSWQKVNDDIIQDVLFYHSKGLSTREIASKVEGISYSTVNRILKENL